MRELQDTSGMAHFPRLSHTPYALFWVPETLWVGHIFFIAWAEQEMGKKKTAITFDSLLGVTDIKSA
jgi:hypothetical protein